MAGEPEGESIPCDLLQDEDFSVRHFQVFDFSDCHVLWVYPVADCRYLRFCLCPATGFFALGMVITNIGRNRYIVKGEF